MPTAGVAPYNLVALVNKSMTMTDSDGAAMVNALNAVLPTFCSDWAIPLVRVNYVKRNIPTNLALQCHVLDNTSGPLNNEVSKDVPYAKVAVKSILDSSGVMLYSDNPAVPTVAARVSHEIFELLADLRSNGWWSSADANTLYAAEVCGPVESNVVKIESKGFPVVGLCDWVLPAWSDANAKVGPFNHNKTLKAPLTVEKTGSVITLKNGVVTKVFGENASAFTRANLCLQCVKRNVKLVA